MDNLLLIAGLLALAFYGCARLYTFTYQAFEAYSFDEQLAGKTPSVSGFVSHLAGRTNALEQSAPKADDGTGILRNVVFAPVVIPDDKDWAPDRLRAFKAAKNPSPGSVLGRLAIPAVDLSVMLLQGTDNWTLNRAVGHIEGTALPGHPGNIGIAGHRDGFFRPLKEISRNAIVTLTTLKGRFFYRVRSINIVKPNDVRLLAPTTRPTLTLVTCYPFHYVGDAPDRYVVTAEMYKIQGAAEIAAERARTRQ